MVHTHTLFSQNNENTADSGGSDEFRDAISDLSLERSGSNIYIFIIIILKLQHLIILAFQVAASFNNSFLIFIAMYFHSPFNYFLFTDIGSLAVVGGPSSRGAVVVFGGGTSSSDSVDSIELVESARAEARARAAGSGSGKRHLETAL